MISDSSLRTHLYRLYWKAEKIITPGLRSSQYSYYMTLRSVVSRSSRWLDLGCGRQVFAAWMTAEQEEIIKSSGPVVGIDLDWPGLRAHTGIRNKVYGDLIHLPIRAASFGVVTANMVMEHVPEPSDLLAEVHRVLTPGGVFVVHTPNYYHWGTLMAAYIPNRMKKLLIRFLEGRRERDVFETHYSLNTARRFREVAAHAGFDVADISLVSSSATLKMLGPIVLFELMYIRALQLRALAGLRSNLVVVLKKRPTAAAYD